MLTLSRTTNLRIHRRALRRSPQRRRQRRHQVKALPVIDSETADKMTWLRYWLDIVSSTAPRFIPSWCPTAPLLAAVTHGEPYIN